MNNKYRTNYCDDINIDKIGQEIKVAGWVDSLRDHGGILFLDLRDSKGILQITSEDSTIFKDLSKETVIEVTGIIQKRNSEDINKKIKTGEVELVASNICVLSKCTHTLPFEIKTSKSVSDELRLKYRFLDLRNPKMHNTVLLRSELLHFIRNMMHDMDFTEIQTPILTASSPEGARDFVIPSRNYPGKFYALPQAPQIYKQLLMVSGIDKYYQIAPCFRDEDPRADRTLEFYQLDIEKSFVEIDELYSLGEKIYNNIFNKFSKKKIVSSIFPRITYKDSMLKYGNDKPDLRNPLEIVDLSSIFENTSFKPFINTIVRGIKINNIGDKTNSWYNDIVNYANSIGMPGIGYINILEDMSFKGPIDKFLNEEERTELINVASLEKNSALFFIADKKNYNKYAGLIRTYLGEKLGLINHDEYAFCIINDFPMFELDEETDKYEFGHNPFSMPKCNISDLDSNNLADIVANQFDFVCNGEEMASGAIRNNNLEMLYKCFSLVGYDKETVKEKFKSITNAFEFGAPPHGGFAPGLDRILMMLLDESNLREVQTFPPAASGQDLLMGCPSTLSEKQLREIHLKIR